MVDLGHNRIQTLPHEIGNLTALDSYFYLHNNRLDTIPESIGALTQLRYSEP